MSVARLTGNALPYADNLVNLLVSEQPTTIPAKEIERVLAPLGVALINGKKTVKPWPSDIDEWTHFLHDAGNNPVAQDARVGPPKHLQWVGGPLWARSHELHPSIVGLVSAGGRMFYLHDEGPIGIFDPSFPERWALVARDAFNGKVLWKRQIGNWIPLTRRFGWLGVSVDVNRRIVASPTAVYLSLGPGKPVSALDAVTGEVLRSYAGTENTELLALNEGVLLTLAPTGRRKPWLLTATEAETGRRLWQRNEKVPYDDPALAARGDALCYKGQSGIVCADLRTGQIRWQSDTSLGKNQILMMVPDRIIVGGSGVTVLSAKDGKPLWKAKSGGGFSVPGTTFFTAGLVWPGVSSGLDPDTGKIVRKSKVEQTAGHHHRCHMQKATERFLLASHRGVEFVPVREDGSTEKHDWIRGTCKLGVVPCNGLLYVPQDGCFCYPGSKVHGMNAVAAARTAAAPEPADRLERGPAFDEPAAPDKARSACGDWPTYRGDPTRSGAAAKPLGAKLTPAWTCKIGGKLTAPVVADGKVFVSSVDAHRVHAVDVSTGKAVWSRTVGGRVDSPPTIYRGRVLFGCRDGWIYCLRSSDGALCWRFLAAPREQWIGAFDQIESAWPAHGSVLVQNEVAFVTAGRSTFLDGGITMFALDPLSGKILHQEQLFDADQSQSDTFSMPIGERSDILVGGGDRLYMGRKQFSAALKIQPGEPAGEKGITKVGMHLMPTSGFLDDSNFSRTFWTYTPYWPGYFNGYLGPKSGQLLVFNENTTYGVKIYDHQNPKHFRSPFYTPGSGCVLFADDNDAEPDFVNRGTEQRPKDDRVSFIRKTPPKWSVRLPIRARALALAGEHLFIAGPMDVLPEDDPLASFEGRGETRLLVASTTDGKTLAEHKLAADAVFDALACADGKLYVSLTDGTLKCLAAQ